MSRLHRIFRKKQKRTTTVLTQGPLAVLAAPFHIGHTVLPSVGSLLPPGQDSASTECPLPSGNTSKTRVQDLAGVFSPTETFKNTILFAAKIAGDSGVPWVKMVTESVINIMQRFETMKLNREAARDLGNDIEAFIFIVARSVALKPDDQAIEEFTKRILRIQAEMPESRSRVSRFINAEETRDIVTHLRQTLDSAVQLFQTGLQISLVESMHEFKEWKTGIKNNATGDVFRNVLNMTYNTRGNFKINTEATGALSSTLKHSKFTTAKAYTQHSHGASVIEILENSTVDADEDIDIKIIASGMSF